MWICHFRFATLNSPEACQWTGFPLRPSWRPPKSDRSESSRSKCSCGRVREAKVETPFRQPRGTWTLIVSHYKVECSVFTSNTYPFRMKSIDFCPSICLYVVQSVPYFCFPFSGRLKVTWIIYRRFFLSHSALNMSSVSFFFSRPTAERQNYSSAELLVRTSTRRAIENRWKVVQKRARVCTYLVNRLAIR